MAPNANTVDTASTAVKFNQALLFDDEQHPFTLSAHAAGGLVDESSRRDILASHAENVSEFLIGLFEASDVAQNMAAAREMLRHGRERAEALSDDPVAQAQMLHALGRAYHNLQEYNDAGILLSRAFVIRDSLYPNGHQDLARTGYHLGATMGKLTLGDSAYRVLQNALDMARMQFDDHDPLIADAMLEPSRIEIGARRYDVAEQRILTGIDLIRRSAGDSSPELVTPFRMLAQLALRRRDYDSADKYFRQAIEHLENTVGHENPMVGTEMLHYGDFLYEHTGDTTRAIQLYRDALAIQERALGPEHILLIHGLNSLAVALADAGQGEEALSLVGRGLRIHRSLFGDHHIGTAREREQYAGVLRRLGRYEEAVPMYRDVIRIKRAADFPESQRWMVDVYPALANLYRTTGRPEEAARYEAKAAALNN